MISNPRHRQFCQWLALPQQCWSQPQPLPAKRLILLAIKLGTRKAEEGSWAYFVGRLPIVIILNIHHQGPAGRVNLLHEFPILADHWGSPLGEGHQELNGEVPCAILHCAGRADLTHGGDQRVQRLAQKGRS